MFLALAAVWLTGFGLVRRMLPQPLRWSLHNVLLFSLGIGVGSGVASCLYFLTLVLIGPNRTVVIAVTSAAAVGALVLGLLARRQGTLLSWAEGPAPWYLTVLFGLASALAVAVFVAAVSNNPHGDEGAWSIWNLRARFLVRAGTFWRDAFSSDLSWTHLDYPLLLSGLVALCWTLIGEEPIGVPIAIAFLFTLGTAGVLMGTLGVLRGRAYALIAGTLLLGTVSFIALGAAQYGDVPLGFYILATLALLCVQDRWPEDPRFSALAGLSAGFAAWTRNEGIIFLVAAIVARVVAMLRFRERADVLRQMLRLAAGVAAPLAIVIFFKLRVGGPNELLSLKPALIFQHFIDPGRWILTVQGLVAVLFSMGRFLIPIVLVLALYWYLVRFQVDSRDRAALATAGIALGLTLATELVVNILFVDNLALEVSTSFERCLLQLWPAGLLMFFLASGPLQLVAAEKVPEKGKPSKKAPKPARSVAGTR